MRAPNFLRDSEVYGRIIPIGWDSDKVTKFSLYTNEGEDLIIEPLDKDNSLENLKGCFVKIIGTIYETNFGSKILFPVRIYPLPDGNIENQAIKPEDEFLEDASISLPDTLHDDILDWPADDELYAEAV